jgi:superfamily II DNA/RNA helicase
LASLNITSPSPIQAAAMPRILAGSNVAVQSYTGSGKVNM